MNSYPKIGNYIDILKIKDALILIVVFLMIVDTITTVYGISTFKNDITEKNIITKEFINIFGLIVGITLSFIFKTTILIFIYYLDYIFKILKLDRCLNNFYVNVLSVSAIFISMITTLHAVVNNFIWIYF